MVRITTDRIFTAGNAILNVASLPTILAGGGITTIHGVLVVATLAAFAAAFIHERRTWPAISVGFGAGMWCIMLVQSL